MATLQDIRDKVRQLTGRKSTVQLTNSQIDFQINNYYLNHFPLQLRTIDLRSEYNFTTQPNVDVYPFDGNLVQSFGPTAYIEGYAAMFFQDRTVFHSMYPYIRNDIFITRGDGTNGATTPYTGIITPRPILKGSVLIYAQTAFSSSVSLVDGSDGNLYQSLSTTLIPTVPVGTVMGTINYETGAVSFKFGDTIQFNVPDGAEIRCQSKQYFANRPTGVLYFDNQIVLRPVPDRCYNVQLIVYLVPTALAGNGSSPVLNEWWETLAYGASKKIFENQKDLESVEQMDKLLSDSFIEIGRRQWYQMQPQGTKTIYNMPIYGLNSPYAFTGPYNVP